MRFIGGLGLAGAISLSVAALSATFAKAQEDSSTYLGTITVTGSRTAQEVQDSPRSVSVVTREELDKKSPESIAEMLRDVPGLEITDANVAGMKRIRIRGESSRRVTVLIDGQEITDHSSYGTPILVDPSVIERIEVIRGPASVLYGTKSIGGVINIITKKGGDKPFEAEIVGTYFSATDGYQTSVNIGGTTSNNFDYFISGSRAEHGDRDVAGTSFDPTGKLVGSGFEDDNISAHLGYRFGAKNNHYISFKAEKHRLDANVWTDPEDLGYDPITDVTTNSFFIDLPQRDRKKVAVFYDAEDLGPVLKKIHIDAYRQTIDRIFTNEINASEINTDFGPPIDVISDLKFQSVDTITDIGGSFQADLKPHPDHYVIGGYQYLSDNLDKALSRDMLIFAPALGPNGVFVDIDDVPLDKAETKTQSVFIQDQWNIAESLELTAGLRYYMVDSELKKTTRGTLGTTEDNELVKSVGLTFSGIANTTLRGLYSEGYVYPTLLQLYVQSSAGGASVHPNANLKPETSQNYEFGIRHEANGFVLDATAYYTEAEDFLNRFTPCTQITCPGAQPNASIWNNIDGATTYGIEVFAEYAIPNTQLTPYVNAAWTKRELDYGVFSTFDSNTPEYSGRAGLKYDWTYSSKLRGWADLYVRAATGAARRVQDGHFDEEDSWATLNLAVGAFIGSDESLQVSIAGNNLTDEAYRPTVDELPGTGRSIVVTARQKF